MIASEERSLAKGQKVKRSLQPLFWCCYVPWGETTFLTSNSISRFSGQNLMILYSDLNKYNKSQYCRYTYQHFLVWPLGYQMSSVFWHWVVSFWKHYCLVPVHYQHHIGHSVKTTMISIMKQLPVGMKSSSKMTAK